MYAHGAGSLPACRQSLRAACNPLDPGHDEKERFVSACERLGLNRSTLRYKLCDLGLGVDRGSGE